MLQFHCKSVHTHTHTHARAHFISLSISEKLLYSTKLFYSFLSGDIISFDIFTTRTTVSQVKLTDISQTCINPLNKNIYELIGVVSYKKPMDTNISGTNYTSPIMRASTDSARGEGYFILKPYGSRG